MIENRLAAIGAPLRLLHGGDYNPDQWLDHPEILEEDVELMKKAHVNCVSLGIFAWSRLEPEEGRFDFDWLQKIMDNLYANGIYTILATPTGAMPRWLTDNYPEANKVTALGLRRIHGERHNFCPSSPVVRSRMHAIDSALSERFGKHPGLVAWHISNEYGGDSEAAACHCPHCEAAFREWLKARYGTIEELNRAWWTDFWSNRVSSWDEIHSPMRIGEQSLHGLKLDWHRFVSDRIADFCRAEIAAVREHSDAPAVANLMGAFYPLDYFRLSEELDMASYDSYPHWHSEESDVKLASDTSFYLSITRSFKKQPFLLMESVPSAVNWAKRCTLKRPGMHMLSSMQAVANGSDSVQYFQWRKSRGGSEKFHGAVVDHKNGSDTRVFREVAQVGARLEALSPKVLGTCNRPDVAILFDWENRWAVDDAQAVVNGMDYAKKVMDYYRPFWEQGVDVDLVNMDSDISGYSLVVAPLNYMYRGKWLEHIREYVKNGGTFVTTYWSGEVDGEDMCFLGSHPLRDMLGIRTEEIDVRPLHSENAVLWDGRRYAIRDLCAVVHSEGAQVLATYEKDFYAGYPALTRNNYGKGTAYFVAAECGEDFLRDLTVHLTHETGTSCTLAASFPEGVTVSRRVRDDGSGLWFVQNFNDHSLTISLHESLRDAETGETLSGDVKLDTFQCLVLEKA